MTLISGPSSGLMLNIVTLLTGRAVSIQNGQQTTGVGDIMSALSPAKANTSDVATLISRILELGKSIDQSVVDSSFKDMDIVARTVGVMLTGVTQRFADPLDAQMYVSKLLRDKSFDPEELLDILLNIDLDVVSWPKVNTIVEEAIQGTPPLVRKAIQGVRTSFLATAKGAATITSSPDGDELILHYME
jgi:hypothetical protein